MPTHVLQLCLENGSRNVLGLRGTARAVACCLVVCNSRQISVDILRDVRYRLAGMGNQSVTKLAVASRRPGDDIVVFLWSRPDQIYYLYCHLTMCVQYNRRGLRERGERGERARLSGPILHRLGWLRGKRRWRLRSILAHGSTSFIVAYHHNASYMYNVTNAQRLLNNRHTQNMHGKKQKTSYRCSPCWNC